jgi:hypothetical protein
MGKARALFSLASSFRVLRSDVDFMEVSLLDAGLARQPVATMDVRPTAARDERATSRLTLRAHRAASSLARPEVRVSRERDRLFRSIVTTRFSSS